MLVSIAGRLMRQLKPSGPPARFCRTNMRMPVSGMAAASSASASARRATRDRSSPAMARSTGA